MKQRPNRRLKRIETTYRGLEIRTMLAGIYHNPINGILYIAGDSGNNVGQVDVSGDNVVAEIDGKSFSGASSTITDIVFIGYDGNDTFTNLSDRASSMYGQLGSDTLIGGSGDDNLVGGPGSDTIQGLGGDDRIVGANGNDFLEGGDGDDRIFGTAGTNTIYGGNGDDTIYGSEDIDEIFGEGGADKIYALGGDDIIHTGGGGVVGGSFAQGDVAMGHGGDDQFFGGSGLDIFYGGDGDDVVVGGVGENRIHGQGGNDTMTGSELGDYMTGGDGDDTFSGRGGVDFYNFGSGSDTVVYSTQYSPSEVRVESNNATSAEILIQGERLSGATWIQFSDRTISGNQESYSIQDESNFSRLNGYRIGSSQSFVSKPADLAEYAMNWSLQMAAQGRESGSPLGDQQGLLTDGRSVVGENVASVSDTGQSATEISNYFHALWSNSPTDNANMLRSDFKEVGIAIINSGGMWWATQIYTG